MLWNTNVNNWYCSTNSLNNWVQFSFPNATFEIENYSILQHKGPDYLLKSYEFEGSYDNMNFITLDAKSEMIVSHSQWYTFSVSGNYPIYRIRNTGFDSNGDNFFVMSSFELYGTYKPSCYMISYCQSPNLSCLKNHHMCFVLWILHQ